jgi:hypothetical protein
MSLQDTKKLVLYKLGLVTSCALGMLLSSTLTKAQTASLLQLPSVSVAAGIPAPLNQTVCSTALDIYGNGCPPTAALLSAPVSTAIDGYGNIYIADSTNKELRVIYKGNCGQRRDLRDRRGSRLYLQSCRRRDADRHKRGRHRRREGAAFRAGQCRSRYRRQRLFWGQCQPSPHLLCGRNQGRTPVAGCGSRCRIKPDPWL